MASFGTLDWSFDPKTSIENFDQNTRAKTDAGQMKSDGTVSGEYPVDILVRIFRVLKHKILLLGGLPHSSVTMQH